MVRLVVSTPIHQNSVLQPRPPGTVVVVGARDDVWLSMLFSVPNAGATLVARADVGERPAATAASESC